MIPSEECFGISETGQQLFMAGRVGCVFSPGFQAFRDAAAEQIPHLCTTRDRKLNKVWHVLRFGIALLLDWPWGLKVKKFRPNVRPKGTSKIVLILNT
jgi:hypothetical protein